MGRAAAHAEAVLSCSRDEGDDPGGVRPTDAAAVSIEDVEAAGSARRRAMGAEPMRSDGGWRPGGRGKKPGA